MNRYIALALITFLVSCKSETENPNPTPENPSNTIQVTSQQFKTLQMEVGTPSNQPFATTITATGIIDVPSQNKAQVASSIGGYIKTTHLLIGQTVTQGQALLTLENPEYIDIQKEYLTAKEQLTYLKSEYDRQKTLFDEKITSQKNYLKAESDYRQTKGIYTTLRQKLKVLNINPTQVEQGKITSVVTLTAPISGVITLNNSQVGKLVTATDVIAEIIQPTQLFLFLNIFEKDILSVKPNQTIQYTLPQSSKKTYQATILTIGKTVDTNQRTIQVVAKLPETDKQQLFSGMFAQAQIYTQTQTQMALPLQAVITEGTKSYVLKLQSKTNQNYTFTKTEVTTGQKNENYIQIIPNQSITPQTQLLLKGVYDLVE